MSEEEEPRAATTHVRVGQDDKHKIEQLSDSLGVPQRDVVHSVLGILEYADTYGYTGLVAAAFSPEKRARVIDYMKGSSRAREDMLKTEKEERLRILGAKLDALKSEEASVMKEIEKVSKE